MHEPNLRSYLVMYNLLDAGRDYGPFFRVIQSTAAYARPMRTAWVVQSRRSPSELIEALSKYIGKDDRLLVIECGNRGAWHSVIPQTVEWLERMFNGSEKNDDHAAAA